MNLCASESLERKIKKSRLTIAVTIEHKIIKYRRMFSTTYTFLPLTVRMCRSLGPHNQALIKTMAIRRVGLQDGMPTGWARVAVKGRETEQVHRHSSFILQHTLSQRTQHHLCRQGVLCTEATRLYENPGGRKRHRSRHSSDELGAKMETWRREIPSVSARGRP